MTQRHYGDWTRKPCNTYYNQKPTSLNVIIVFIPSGGQYLTDNATFDLSCGASPHSRIFVDEQLETTIPIQMTVPMRSELCGGSCDLALAAISRRIRVIEDFLDGIAVFMDLGNYTLPLCMIAISIARLLEYIFWPIYSTQPVYLTFKIQHGKDVVSNLRSVRLRPDF